MARNLLTTVINVNRNRLSFCGGNISGLLSLTFPPNVVRDLEITDPNSFVSLVKSFITQHQINPSPLVIVLDKDVYFDKDLTSTPVSDIPLVSQKFLDTVPLASISSRILKIGVSTHLIAINRHFYESLKLAFESSGFSVIAVVPALDSFTENTCHLILKRIDYIKENSLITQSEASQSFYQKEQKFLKKHQSLLAIFSLLAIAIFFTFLYLTFRKPSQISTSSIQFPASTPTLTSTPTPISTPSASLSSYTVRILNGSGISNQASQVEKDLRSIGFTEITIGNSPTTPSKTLIVFSPKVPPQTRQLVIDQLQKSFSEVDSLENDQAQFDIFITTGQVTP